MWVHCEITELQNAKEFKPNNFTTDQRDNHEKIADDLNYFDHILDLEIVSTLLIRIIEQFFIFLLQRNPILFGLHNQTHLFIHQRFCIRANQLQYTIVIISPRFCFQNFNIICRNWNITCIFLWKPMQVYMQVSTPRTRECNFGQFGRIYRITTIMKTQFLASPFF